MTRRSPQPQPAAHRPAPVVLFNKPYGVVCRFGRDGTTPTLADFLDTPHIYPAGRLDADSEGLVVLTSDGALQHRITDPRHKLPKTYYAQVEGIPSADALDRLRAGVTCRGYTTRPAEARPVDEPAWLWARVPPIRTRRHIPATWIELTLAEGRNRQVRHMTAAVGHPTLRLVRYSIDSWTLDGLACGAWRTAAGDLRNFSYPRQPSATRGVKRR
jgi:23S rRNA pseudouridine2457 synthase